MSPFPHKNHFRLLSRSLIRSKLLETRRAIYRQTALPLQEIQISCLSLPRQIALLSLKWCYHTSLKDSKWLKIVLLDNTTRRRIYP